MKHITTYKLFESSKFQDVLDNLSDIFLDMEDEGYKSIVQEIPVCQKYDLSGIEVWMLKPVTLGDTTSPLTNLYYNSFSFVKVKEVFERMVRYMESKGWTSELEYFVVKFTGGYWTSFEGKSTEKHICYRIRFYPLK